MTPNYDAWSKEELIARLTDIEQRLKPIPSRKKPVSSSTPGGSPFHFDRHPRRKIAVKFCYSGWEYNGLAFQNDPTPLPTVEEVLFRAFAKARLVDLDAGLDGCGWERCGRTDVGVSAAGQVVSLWVRSVFQGLDAEAPPRPELADVPVQPTRVPAEGAGSESAPVTPDVDEAAFAFAELDSSPPDSPSEPPRPPDRELHYVSILNRILPPTIRVLAWSPVSPSFSARFNCKYRHYKYFFTAHGLDVSLMQRAADYLVGEHDFRNLSKLDPAKQITDFCRRIVSAQVNPVEPSPDSCGVTKQAGHDDQFYVLDLVGNAFLYHQVRHIMAILFLVGTGLEPPSIIPTLMNTNGSESARTGLQLPVVDRKPEYQMADALPLMLWECAFSDSDVHWQSDGDVNTNVACENNPNCETGSLGMEKHSGTGLVRQIHSVYQRSLIHSALEGHFLSAAVRYHPVPPQYFPFSRTGLSVGTIPRLPNNTAPVIGVPLGGGTCRRGVKYVPLLSRKRLDHVDVANARWKNGKGSRHENRKALISTAETNGNE
ncbi:pseudouridine synthase [Pisolithus microcarpus]|nr:pseudouridine synthase [Pisolithus microcarpus]